MFRKADLCSDLEKSGLKAGDIVMVHSSLSSLGWVWGGADAVIDALLEVIGEDGTLLMPALTAGSKQVPFEGKQTPSYLGEINEAFRRRGDVKRSFHPTHSVLALGKDADYLIADHLEAESACGLGTPYFKLTERGGYVLMLGVDLDRCTLMHTAEDLADCPFLGERTFYYRDSEGAIQEKVLKRFPGPHRDFIGLDQHLRKAGIIKLGRVGSAVTRLIKAQDLLLEATRLLKENPAAVLCDNPSCQDCLQQKGKIRSNLLLGEKFKLAALISDFHPGDDSLDLLSHYAVNRIELSDYLTRKILINGDLFLDALCQEVAERKLNISGLGITTSLESLLKDNSPTDLFEKLGKMAECLDSEFLRLRIRQSQELSPSDETLLESIKIFASFLNKIGITLLLVNDPQGPLATPEVIKSFFSQLKAERIENVGFAFDPAGFVESGKKPFLNTFKQTSKAVRNLYLTDSCFKSGKLTGLMRGNGEIKELVSALRCRSYSGYFTVGGLTDYDPFSLEERLGDFWDFFSLL
jgi:aminoglycoside 3-N-acetyltransferase